MYTIADLVKVDEHIAEQSVVQIDFYNEQERNLALLKSFVFAPSAPEGMASNLAILHKLREASLTDAKENVFCIIANYGHGKSHFGLVLANYFGREVNSEEFRVLMDKIVHAEVEEVRARNLREFREARKPYLVVRLHGDSSRSLDQQFLKGVQNALREAGINGKLPLWYEKAAEWLEVLPQKGLAAQANEFLRQYRLDLQGLIALVREYNEDTHELVNNLHKRLVDTVPHFEGDLEAKDLLKWVVDHYCKKEQRFGGVLILFDEFSLFVEAYYADRKHVGSLQRLLETVDALRRQVLFVAFAQHDPVQMAIYAMSSASQPQRAEALRELQRLPEHNKLRLYTRMEQVIDGYLRQQDRRFSRLLDEHRELDDMLWDAGGLALKAFSSRYSEEQQWTHDQFFETVCKGCFPLHPLTTALLSQGFRVGVMQVDTPRTVLGFVVDRVQRKLGEPALLAGNTPNWIYAIELVDYFKDMLPEHEMQQYYSALQRIEGTPSEEQVAVLKAIVLISVSGMTTQRSNFVDIVAHLTGLSTSRVAQTLKELSDLRALFEHDGRYRFHSLGVNPKRLNALRDEKWNEPIWDEDVRLLNAECSMTQEISVPWGHPRDWEANQSVWLVQDFTEDNLREKAPLITKNVAKWNGSLERGLVIRVLALCEEDMVDLEERVRRVMDQAFPDENAPAVLVLLPPKPQPELVKLMRWRSFLENMSRTAIEEIGEELVIVEKDSARRAFEEVKADFFSDRLSPHGESERRWVVPKAYRPELEKRNPRTLSDALLFLYQQAYRYAPPFFTQFRQGAHNLRLDVKQLCIKLAEDKVEEILKTFGNRPGTTCVQKFLQGEWGILNSNYSIQPPPATSKVYHAWAQLDKSFSTKEAFIPVRVALRRLLNPPYGYDCHQLALLLSAWYGYNRSRIEFRIDGWMSTLSSIWNENKVGYSEQFIGFLLTRNVTIRQRDLDSLLLELERMAVSILDPATTMPLSEAESKLAKLGGQLGGVQIPVKLREQIGQAISRLEEGIRLAREYDQRAAELLALADNAAEIEELAEACADHRLPEVGPVEPTQPSAEKIRDRLMARIRERVESVCAEAGRVSTLEDVGRYKEELHKVLTNVRRTKNQDLEAHVQKAIALVEQRSKQLRQRAEEADLIGEMRAMSSQAPLVVLRNYQQRLREVVPKSPDARQIHAAKNEEIEEAIRRAEERLREWHRLVCEIKEERDLVGLLEDIHRHWFHYENSDEMQKLKDLEKTCKSIATRLERVRQIISALPTSPVGVLEVRKQLAQVSNDSDHPAVRSAVERAVRALEDYVEKKKDEASNWLRQREQEAQQANGDDLYRVLQRLSSPPAFLRERDKAKLDDLRTMVQQRFEDDMEAVIRARLRQIRNVDKLRRLREEIDKLLSELGNGRA